MLNARDLERYKRLLVTKRDELSAARDEGATVLPSASASDGDFMDQANADAEAELQIRLRQTDGRLFKAIEDALARIRAGTFGVCGACKGLNAKDARHAGGERHARTCAESLAERDMDGLLGWFGKSSQRVCPGSGRVDSKRYRYSPCSVVLQSSRQITLER